jgi:hypothetical protein
MFNSPNKSVGVIKGAPPQGKNLIINGNLTVDQRQGSDPDFIADRWKVVDANNMTQIIEDKNFEPSTEYTLSWEGGTPQKITSPASGHWTLPNIPRTARKIQLEVGDEATEFEHEDYGTTLAKCQRYYQAQQGTISMTAGKSVSKDLWFPWMTEMRMVPAVSVGSPDSVPTTITPYSSGLRLAITVSGIDNVNRVNSIIADAEL